jgi:hypothetical protein
VRSPECRLDPARLLVPDDGQVPASSNSSFSVRNAANTTRAPWNQMIEYGPAGAERSRTASRNVRVNLVF